MYISFRCDPQHGAAGLREVPQPHPVGGGVRLRHEAVRSRHGHHQGQQALQGRMERYGIYFILEPLPVLCVRTIT